MPLEKYSLGIGDRFGREGQAQLRALEAARRQGVRITPVWNKSNREHTIIGTSPEDTRRSADQAVRACGWTDAYYVDADHIGPATVDKFIGSCDFFTIDIADLIGQPPPADEESAFLRAMSGLKGTLRLPGLETPIEATDSLLAGVAAKYLSAVAEAGRVQARIAEKQGTGGSLIEISLDEAGAAQTPDELFFILAAIARQGIPVRTIAPKFSGAFLKGIDYVGDVDKFAREFDADLAVLEAAKQRFGLPGDLKLSVHSGSDKFSLYPVMRRAILRRDAGLHLKTAGTTWLEEVIGLASAGGEGLRLAQDIYAQALARFDELARPYLRRDLHRPLSAPLGRGCGRVGRAGVRRRAPARPALPAVQSPFPAARPHRLQDRRRDGRPLYRPPRDLSGADRNPCHGEPLRPAHRPAVPRRFGV